MYINEVDYKKDNAPLSWSRGLAPVQRFLSHYSE